MYKKSPSIRAKKILFYEIPKQKFRVRIGRPLEYQIKTRRTLMSEKIEEMNLHQKILKIANIAGVLQKTKAGFNYKYVPEEEIQAKVTAGMQKYHVTLIPDIAPGSTQVIPYSYTKQKKEKIKDESDKEKLVMVDTQGYWHNNNQCYKGIYNLKTKRILNSIIIEDCDIIYSLPSHTYTI